MLAIFGFVVKPEKFILTINGKELDRTHGLDWYDYGARQYDPFVPGFTSLDPMCEKYYYVSPYVYCGNNPIIAIDPTGCDSVFAKKLFSGTIYYIGDDGKNTGNVYVVKGKTKRAVIAATKIQLVCHGRYGKN